MSTLPTLSEEVQSIRDIPSSGTLTPVTEPTLHGDPPLESERVPAKSDTNGGLRFWMIFVALMVSTFLSALDFVCINAVINLSRTFALTRPAISSRRVSQQRFRQSFKTFKEQSSHGSDRHSHSEAPQFSLSLVAWLKSSVVGQSFSAL